jgi:serine/threonine-protein kinase
MGPDPLVGTTVGHFVLEEELGRGGMGVVYRATDLVLRRPVAIKLLAPELVESTSAKLRFQKEINTAARLEHPHIVPVYNGGLEDDHFFIVMRFVEGPDLARVIELDGPLSEERAVRLLGQIASALYSVHSNGLIHRDVKPKNVLVWNAGEPDEHTFLTDFGLAKALDDVGRVTTAGIPGTPGYMAPELLSGLPPTPASDQYSLGCLAFELITGCLPNDGEELGAEVLRLAELAPRVSARLREAIQRSLAPRPSDRFPDIRAFALQDGTANEAFERAQAITHTVEYARSDSELVEALYTDHGLSDAAIGEIADLEKSRVMLLRRRAARRSLIGE